MRHRVWHLVQKLNAKRNDFNNLNPKFRPSSRFAHTNRRALTQHETGSKRKVFEFVFATCSCQTGVQQSSSPSGSSSSRCLIQQTSLASRTPPASADSVATELCLGNCQRVSRNQRKLWRETHELTSFCVNVKTGRGRRRRKRTRYPFSFQSCHQVAGD